MLPDVGLTDFGLLICDAMCTGIHVRTFWGICCLSVLPGRWQVAGSSQSLVNFY